MSRLPGDGLAVLLVDDSEDDRWLIRHALREFPKLRVVGEVYDGEEAISYLSGLGEFGDRQRHPFPDLMLLDLKMPVRTGYDVLRWLKTSSFERLKVVVVSGSLLHDDKDQSLSLGAIGYLHKADLKKELNKLTGHIEHAFGLGYPPSAGDAFCGSSPAE